MVLDGPGRLRRRRGAADDCNGKAGLIWQWGALDFAGGTVVHINAAMAGLVGAYMVGKRIGFGREAFTPHSLTQTMVGASLLWVGWFGFNAGSALEANGYAALAFINTFVATAAAVLAWSLGETFTRGKASMLGAASGAVAGLVAITPAAGNVGIAGRAHHRLSSPASPACGASPGSRRCSAPTTRSMCSAYTASAASSARC